MDLYFRKTADTATGATWEYHAMTIGGVTGGTAGTPTEIQTGTFDFDLTGKLNTVTPGAGTFNPINATQAQALTINLGDSLTTGGTGLLGVTSFAATSAATQVTQNGYGSGVLSSISVDKEGQVQGSFSNGQSRIVGQLAIASVPASDQLERAAETCSPRPPCRAASRSARRARADVAGSWQARSRTRTSISRTSSSR